MAASVYPEGRQARSTWIAARRGSRNAVKPDQPYAWILESERSAEDRIAQVATIFLTNRECSWRCVMCDLWRNTTTSSVGPGDISSQIRYALERLPRADILKLYNSGSFFDRAAIPWSEHAEIAELTRPFERLIVECHPRLITPAILEFRDRLDCSFEIAMGLETVEPNALEKINKGISLQDYSKAARFLNDHGIDVRTFLLVYPPFIDRCEQGVWLQRSIDYAAEQKSAVISLIPGRGGNGAMEALAASGEFREPGLRDLENGLDYGLRTHRRRVFADTWDLERFSRCGACFTQRKERLVRMNLAQTVEPRVICSSCHEPAI